MSDNSLWLHIGAGSFHRAHQAWYLHRLLQLQSTQPSSSQWTIALGNIRNDVNCVLAALAAQQGEYVLETVSPQGERQYEKITSIKQVIPWDSQLDALAAVGAQPQTRIISFTVTESGYYLTPEHELNLQLADIQADLHGATVTIYGALTRILKQRIASQAAPVTLLSCDNLRHNGERFRHGFLTFLQAKGERRLYDWVIQHTRSPNCMVDRITPRPTPDVAKRVQAACGIHDAVPVMGESFIQWVIEDNFIAGRPALELVDVQLVDSVQPWEEAKIRILNASHSGIAWAGTLTGLNFIDESTRQPAIRQMIEQYITQDVIPALTPSPLDLQQYRDVVLDRFTNPWIKDTNQRVAADGLSKIPGMVTPTLLDCYRRGKTPGASALVAGLFFLFLRRFAQGSLPYDYQDGALQPSHIQAMFAGTDPLQQFIRDEALFGELARHPDFHALMCDSVARLEHWLQHPLQPIQTQSTVQ